MKNKISPEEVHADLADFLESAALCHHEDYLIMRDFYLGAEHALRHINKHQREDWHSWELRRKRLVGANYCAPIVDKIARSEYGFDVVRNLHDDGLQARWDAIARANRAGTFQLLTARQRAIDGTCIVQMYWDEDRKRTCWRHVQPENFFPIVLPGDNYDEVSAVVILRDTTAQDIGGTHRLRDTEGSGDEGNQNINTERGDRVLRSLGRDDVGKEHRVEIYTPEAIAVWEGNQRVGTSALKPWEHVASYGTLPFVVFNGKTLVGDVFGYSFARGIVELNHFINRHLSNLSQIIDYQAFSLLVVNGGITGLSANDLEQINLNLNYNKFLVTGEGGDAKYVNPQPRIQEIVDVINKTIEMMFEVGNVPLAAVKPQQSHEESGISRQVQWMPLRDLVEELHTQDRWAERDLIAKSLHIDAVHRGDAGTFESMEERLVQAEIAYPKRYLPVDRATDVEVYTMRHEAGLEGRKERMAEEHPEMDEPEIEAKMREIDDEKEQEDTIFAGPAELGQTKTFPHVRAKKSQPMRQTQTQAGGRGNQKLS